MSDKQTSPKKIFNLLKSALNNTDHLDRSLPPIFDTETNELKSNSKDKANIFGKMFANASTVNYDGKVPDTTDQADPYAILNDIEFSAAEITLIITKLNAGKAAGPDRVGNKAIKMQYPALIELLPQLFRNSLSRGVFPDQWKKGCISPVYKNKGDKQDSANYRPITLKSVLAKSLRV